MTQKAVAEPERFNQAKLEAMIEPFHVRVERIRGQTRSPIPMPQPNDGGAPGTGFDKTQVMGLETWLFTEWSGGGSYRIMVTDSDQPKPTEMRWSTFSELPEIIPPPHRTAAQLAPPKPVASSAPQPHAVYMASGFPNGLPPGGYFAHPQALPPAPPQQPHGYPPGYYPPGSLPYGYGYGQAQQPPQPQTNVANDYERRAMEAQLGELRAQIARANEETLKRGYDAQLIQERAATDARFTRLESTITSLVTTINNLGTSSSKNPEIEALREANRLSNEKFEQERRERMTEQREATLREAMRVQHEGTLRQIEAMQAQFQQFMQLNANRAPDPMIGVIQEQMRSSIDAQKELARNQATSLDKLLPFMMTPQTMSAMARDASQGIDVVTGQMTRAYGNLIDVQARMLEQNAPGGKTAIDLIEQGVEKIAGLGQRWVQGKNATEKAAHDAVAAQATAQARAVESQASVLREQARAHAQANVVHVPPPPVVQQQVSSGLGGTNGTNGTSPPPNGTKPDGTVDYNLNGSPVTPIKQAPKRGGRTDREWFGPLYEDVLQLREGVRVGVESATMTPVRTNANGQLIGMHPEQVVGIIEQAKNAVLKAGIPVPAMVDLLAQERWADFIDILLPDTPQGYKDHVIQLMVPDGKESDDDGEDEEEDEIAS